MRSEAWEPEIEPQRSSVPPQIIPSSSSRWHPRPWLLLRSVAITMDDHTLTGQRQRSHSPPPDLERYDSLLVIRSKRALLPLSNDCRSNSMNPTSTRPSRSALDVATESQFSS